MTTIEMIPLSQLSLSDLNVRKTERDADIDGLAADILARGLKQNLVVTRHDRALSDTRLPYEVIAGGRRLRALQLLADDGALADDYPVPCMIEVDGQAIETSLSENLHRIAMNPADEFLAFKTIIAACEGDEGARIALCAKRFGVTEAHVKGRLRLATLSETILDALRTGIITLGAAKAYACIDNTALQNDVFAKQQKSNWKPHDPDMVRSAMKDETYGLDDPRVIFVGFNAYAKAGGRTDVDLFTLDAGERLIDTKLVDSLFKAKADVQRAKLAKKHKLTDCLLSVSIWAQPKLPDGWAREYDHGGEKMAARVKEGLPTIGSCYLDHKGALVLGEFMAIPVAVAEDGEPIPPRASYVPPTDEERAAASRAKGIELEAARLAIPPCVGTPLENRVFLPAPLGWFRFDETEDGSEVYIEIKFRLTRAEIEANMAAAEVVYDTALAAHAEKQRLTEEAKVMIEAARAAILETMKVDPPAVIELDDYETFFFRWPDGSYRDMQEADATDEDEGEYSFETIDDIISDNTLVASWPSVEAWSERELEPV